MKDIKPTDLVPDLDDAEIPTPICHKYANIFPLMDTNGEDFIKLVKDIQQNGLLNPIVIYERQILDGRNRQAACLMLGVQPTYAEYTGNDPIGFVSAQNLYRRHLTPSQKAMVGARILEIFEEEAKERQRAAGGDHGNQYTKAKESPDLPVQANLPEPPKEPAPQARDQAAAMTGSSPRAVQQAKKVTQEGIPELQAAVDSNQIKVSEAADIASLSPERQTNVIALPKKQRRAAVRAEAKERRAERVKVETGISKEYSKIYEEIFSRAKDISLKFISDTSPKEVARKAIDSFPYHNPEFCKNFLPHLKGVAELFSEMHSLNEANHECRDTQKA